MKPLPGIAQVGWSVVLCVACAPPLPPPPPAPPIDRMASAIPGDLDVAFRVDLAAARRLFGPDVTRGIRIQVADASEDPATADLLTSALEHADALWAAFRPGLPARLTDNVIALRGDFRSIDPRQDARGGFAHPIDLGGGWRSYERPRPRRRSAPARIYARADDRLLFVSEAELDSSERVIELGKADDHVEPPDRGVLSLAARPGPLAALLSDRFPAVAAALDGATRLEASADADERGLRATLDVRFSNDDEAVLSTDRMKKLLEAMRRADGLVARIGGATEATTVGPDLVVRVALDARGLAAALGCLDGGPGC